MPFWFLKWIKEQEQGKNKSDEITEKMEKHEKWLMDRFLKVE